MEKVSIVVPVYNAEKYLDRSVGSLLVQSYENIEIILIDDDSIDSSLDLCKKFEKNDNRVKVYKSERFGVSAARNTGIKQASGKYLCFLDSDDEYEKDFVKNMVSTIEMCGVDLVVCGYKEICDSSTMIKNYNLDSSDVIEYLNAYCCKDSFEHVANYPWNKLYITATIKENNVMFDEKITVSEDAIFNMEYLTKVNKVKVISDALVKHYIIVNSLVTTKINKNIQEYTIMKNYCLFEKNYELRKAEEKFADIIGRFLLYCYLRLGNIYSGKESKEFIKRIQNKHNRKIIKKASCLNMNYKIFKILFSLKMNILLWIYCEIKQRRNK